MKPRKILLTAIIALGLMISLAACGPEETIVTSDSPAVSVPAAVSPTVN